MAVSVSVVYSRGRVADWEPWLLPPPSITGEHLHIAGLGKDPNSEFKVWFLLNAYHFRNIIKSTHRKLNRPKSETVWKIKNSLPWSH